VHHAHVAKSPKEVLEEGHMRTELQGSCTATLATLQEEVRPAATVSQGHTYTLYREFFTRLLFFFFFFWGGVGGTTL